MPTHSQPPHPNGRVVSVRLDDELIGRLDGLAQRTGRSRSVYIKLALKAALPALERTHREQLPRFTNNDLINFEFGEIVNNLGIRDDGHIDTDDEDGAGDQGKPDDDSPQR
jgi:RHH-type rel operon transcriptional repressor/antitoxin RelB